MLLFVMHACVTVDHIASPICFLQFLVEQNDEFQKEKLQEDYNDSYLFVTYVFHLMHTSA